MRLFPLPALKVICNVGVDGMEQLVAVMMEEVNEVIGDKEKTWAYCLHVCFRTETVSRRELLDGRAVMEAADGR